MGLAADLVRANDADITNAYHRVRRIEKHYVTNGATTVVSSTIIVDVYKDKATRDSDGENPITRIGISDASDVVGQIVAYALIATYLGVANVEV